MQSDNSFIKKPLKRKANRSRSTDYKLLIYVVAIVASVIIFNFYEPARDFIVSIGQDIENLDWIGPLLFIAFLGCIVIPFGLPYLIFESTLALLFDSFMLPWIIAVISKFIGCTISFFIARFVLRTKIESWLEKEKFYQSVQRMIDENPWKFSWIFRITLMPYMIKNYGLALPDSINYFIYITTAVSAGALVSAININFSQQTREISEGFFNDTPLGWYNVAMLVVTVSFLLYIVWYTMKMIKLLNSEENIRKAGISIELDATVNDDSTVLDQEHGSESGKRMNSDHH